MKTSNPQAQFEDMLFGTGGLHPTPKSLPYPVRTIQPKGLTKPERIQGMSDMHWRIIEDAYDEGYRTGINEREEKRNVMSRTNTSRRTGRRPGL